MHGVVLLRGQPFCFTEDNHQVLASYWLYNFTMRHQHLAALVLLFLLSLSTLSLINGEAQPIQPITILSPGENSAVMSPIRITAMIQPGEDGLVRLSLVDKNQNLLARQLLRANGKGDSAIEFTSDLVFEIPTESTSAVLLIATQDHLHRPLSTRSVGLTLLSSGEDNIQPQAEQPPWLRITRPLPGMLISDTTIVIEGTVTPKTSKPIIFELVRESGGVMISKQLGVDQPGEPMNFSVSLTYPPNPNVQDIRLVIRQTGEDLGVNVILDSLPIRLAP